jgi:hypothetical protein
VQYRPVDVLLSGGSIDAEYFIASCFLSSNLAALFNAWAWTIGSSVTTMEHVTYINVGESEAVKLPDRFAGIALSCDKIHTSADTWMAPTMGRFVWLLKSHFILRRLPGGIHKAFSVRW